MADLRRLFDLPVSAYGYDRGSIEPMRSRYTVFPLYNSYTPNVGTMTVHGLNGHEIVSYSTIGKANSILLVFESPSLRKLSR